MKLPHAAKARVERKKVVEYLLSSSHPDGSAKARFFIRLDLLQRSGNLCTALKQHGEDHDVNASIESRHGTRDSVDGVLQTPNGRNPQVRTVWVLAKGSESPRLVTAYPI
jgi:hypothetical protein